MEKHISELMDLALQPNSAPAKQELPHSKNGELAVALSEKKIFQISNVGEVEKALRYCMLLVGMRQNNFPAKEETSVLFNHINKYYSGHTVAEIRLAFEMAVAGQLDIDENDVKAYENFSTIYFSQIMNSYRRWASQEVKQVKELDVPPPTKIYTDEETENLHRSDVEAFYQRCRKGIEPEKIPDYFKSILVKDGLMKKEQSTAEFLQMKLNSKAAGIYQKS